MRHHLPAFAILLMTACGQGPQDPNKGTAPLDQVANSRDKLDWAGLYKGELPCDQCAGTPTTVRIDKDGTYRLESLYACRHDTTIQDNGTFTWDDAGRTIILPAQGSGPRKFRVGEGYLIQVDQNGERIEDQADRRMLTKL